MNNQSLNLLQLLAMSRIFWAGVKKGAVSEDSHYTHGGSAVTQQRLHTGEWTWVNENKTKWAALKQQVQDYNVSWLDRATTG